MTRLEASELLTPSHALVEARPWAPPRRLFPWPPLLGGAPRTVGSLSSCSRCPADAHPAQRTTWASYGGEPLCLRHAIKVEAAERGVS